VTDDSVTLSTNRDEADGTITSETREESIDSVLSNYTTSINNPLYIEGQYVTLKVNSSDEVSDLYKINQVIINDNEINYVLENAKTK